MIPISDRNPTSGRVILVPILIAINALVFVGVQPSFDDPNAQTIFVVCEAAIPYEVMHGETLGEAFRPRVPGTTAEVFSAVQRIECPDKSVWRSILQSMFFHGGWLHIIFNMLFLWVFGNNVEDRLGRIRFVLLYFAAGIAATYAQSVISPDSVVPMIGASGAVAGVLGAYLIMFPHARVTNLVILGFFITWIELPAVVVLGLWFLLQVFQQTASVTGAAGGVAYMAHIGGFVAGMLLLLLLRPRAQRARGAPPW